MDFEPKDMLDEPVTTEEVLATINHMKNNKAPSPDGFGAEFYKLYAQELPPPPSLCGL